jgi:hypothetical protein
MVDAGETRFSVFGCGWGRCPRFNGGSSTSEACKAVNKPEMARESLISRRSLLDDVPERESIVERDVLKVLNTPLIAQDM